MDQVISETRRMAIECSELEKEVNTLHGHVCIEEMLLEIVNKEHQGAVTEINLLESIKESLINHNSTLATLGQTTRIGYLLMIFLKKFIENAQPTSEDEKSKLELMRNSHNDMLKNYEMNPTYRAIIEAERYDQELTQSILEKSNQIMQLDAKLFDEYN